MDCGSGWGCRLFGTPFPANNRLRTATIQPHIFDLLAEVMTFRDEFVRRAERTIRRHMVAIGMKWGVERGGGPFGWVVGLLLRCARARVTRK